MNAVEESLPKDGSGHDEDKDACWFLGKLLQNLRSAINDSVEKTDGEEGDDPSV